MPLNGTQQLQRLSILLRQGGPRAVRAAREAMKKEADKIVLLAKSYAPVLQHDIGGSKNVIHGPNLGAGPGPLERSIKREDSIDTDRRLQIQVTAGEGLGDYPLMMEEGLAPYGSGQYQLGPMSRSKRAAGNDVGGKYMERALDARQKYMPDEIVTAVVEELENS
jgi:hypothetical protein